MPWSSQSRGWNKYMLYTGRLSSLSRRANDAGHASGETGGATMATADVRKPPYRADHVGSLLSTDTVKAARKRFYEEK